MVLPQAVRNVIPPLLNDFISLQKDTALVGVLGAIEANEAAQIYCSTVFNYSSYTVAAILFLILTIPLARFTDRRDRPRPQAAPGRGPDVTARGAARAAEGEAIRIEGLRKSFGDQEVLSGIDLSVATHEVICLIGASGLGQVHAAALPQPARADRRRADQPVGAGDHRRGVDQNLVRRYIGIVFQSFNLFPHMSVLRNITLAPMKARGMPRAQAEEEARALLDRFGLADKQADYPDRLSGGQQQRVAIVRALAMQPQIMLLDEVTSALDPELVAEVLDVIRELAAGGMTMLIATHEMGFARDIANRVCFLAEGMIVEDAPPSVLFTDPKDERTRRFLRRIVDAGRL